MQWIRTGSAAAALVAAPALIAVLIASSVWAQAGGGAGGTGQSSPGAAGTQPATTAPQTQAPSDESSIPVYERMNDRRAALGIWFHSLPEGAHIVRVVTGSPAERAGLQPGDFITRINGKPCDDWQATTQPIAEAKPQSILKLEVSRHGLTIPLEAELGGHYEVFSDPDENWNNLAAQYPEGANRFDGTQYNDTRYNDTRYGGTRFNGAGRYWTGRANPTGPDYDQGGRMQPGDTQNLERRIRQLEREVSDLREQLNRETSTGAPASNQNNGQRTSAPPDGQ